MSPGTCDIYKGNSILPNGLGLGTDGYIPTTVLTSTEVFTAKCRKNSSPNILYPDSGTVTVNNTNQPDLIASAPPQNTATLGVLRTFFSTITNQGGAATNYQGTTSFANLFQTATGFDDAQSPINLTDFPAGNNNMTTILAGGAKSATKLISFSTLGTSWVRACADKSSAANTGTINESIEYNNCSAWGPVTVSAVAKPDLIASSPAPMDIIPIIPGVAKNFSSIITNQGTAATNYQGTTSFTNLFQTATGISDPNNPVGLEDHPVAGMTTILVDGTKTASHSFTFPSAGTYYMRACADKLNQNDGGGDIPESNEGNNCSAPWTTVVVGSQALPDLTAGYVSPTTAVVGVNTSFSATISNIGTASTGIGFHNFIQVSIDGVTAVDVAPAISMNALGPAGSLTSSGIMSKLYTFTSTGTYYARVCADKSNRNDPGVITESNENNNCGHWTIITVTNPVAMSVSISADPVFIVLPSPTDTGTTVLTWAVAGTPDTCSASGDWSGFKSAIDGNHTESISGLDAGPPSPHTYTFNITCKKVGVANAIASVSVNVFDKNDKVDGQCDVTHFNCSIGSYDGAGKNDGINWLWTCSGTNGGIDASCSEPVTECPDGLTNYPKCDVCINGADNPPTCTNVPPECPAGLTPYPACDRCINGLTPPTCTLVGFECPAGLTPYPACDTCVNRAIDPPLCITFGSGICSNGAVNYPLCTINNSGGCLNGANNPPTCKKIPKWWEI